MLNNSSIDFSKIYPDFDTYLTALHTIQKAISQNQPLAFSENGRIFIPDILTHSTESIKRLDQTDRNWVNAHIIDLIKYGQQWQSASQLQKIKDIGFLRFEQPSVSSLTEQIANPQPNPQLQKPKNKINWPKVLKIAIPVFAVLAAIVYLPQAIYFFSKAEYAKTLQAAKEIPTARMDEPFVQSTLKMIKTAESFGDTAFATQIYQSAYYKPEDRVFYPFTGEDYQALSLQFIQKALRKNDFNGALEIYNERLLNGPLKHQAHQIFSQYINTQNNFVEAAYQHFQLTNLIQLSSNAITSVANYGVACLNLAWTLRHGLWMFRGNALGPPPGDPPNVPPPAYG